MFIKPSSRCTKLINVIITLLILSQIIIIVIAAEYTLHHHHNYSLHAIFFQPSAAVFLCAQENTIFRSLFVCPQFFFSFSADVINHICPRPLLQPPVMSINMITGIIGVTCVNPNLSHLYPRHCINLVMLQLNCLLSLCFGDICILAWYRTCMFIHHPVYVLYKLLYGSCTFDVYFVVCTFVYVYMLLLLFVVMLKKQNNKKKMSIVLCLFCCYNIAV